MTGQEAILIDPNVLKSELCSVCDMRDACVTVCETIRIINKQPTIKAKPMHYGRWENGECTNCKRNLIELCGGEDYELDMYAESDAIICPFCGAIMHNEWGD